MSDSATHLTPVELASRWSVKVGTLAAWRAQRRGPAFIKLGRKVLYSIEAIERYEAEQRVETDGRDD